MNRAEEGEMVRTALIRFVPATVVVALALALAPLADAANTNVAIDGFAFVPPTVTIHVGDTVTWSNSDPRSHTATADNGSFDTGTIGTGASRSVTFSSAGTFDYHCTIHPSMTASVVVEAAALPPTDAATTSAAPGSSAEVALLALVFIAAAILTRRHLARRSNVPSDPPA